ncbi:TetR/AcrR family transcriptional regulator [Flavobacterium aquariorum]|uniref:TetR/AcrR family transcriptional regulator n=1 Tax=Flavobacterium aquariorum TaxID=2217670 RepID=A0A2W7UCV0_9FLAO|nr:TetR/AcrR family transcriptional regulator [Flavobacterium aquariorum]PZX95329.1 TetR/AcrR family transcriptional regulator [Flavobacterium aquariorum]
MEKKDIILAAALRLFVENGFHGTATARIAQEANVATGTLFNYFRTKEELIVALYCTILKEMDDFILERLESHSISKESFRSLFVSTLSWSLENRDHYRYLQQFDHSPYFKVVEETIAGQEEYPLFVLIKNGIDIVLIKQLPVSFIYSLFTAQINGLHYYIISNDLREDKELELISEAFEMLWKMIED